MKMKKITLALAGLTAVAAFAPEASALPLFARQTGMACSACHFQHFPMLNAFGRSFKASGYTLMGAQGKVEGDDMSLPSTLNMAVLTTAGYVKTDQTATGAAFAVPGVRNAADGSVYVPGTNGEFSLFIGGKVNDYSGALAEVGLTNLAGVGAGVASAKIAILPEALGGHAGLVLFTTGSQGASYGFEVLNTGANAIHTMLFAGGDHNGSIVSTLSAQQYIGTNGAATGAALVASNDMGFVNVSKYHTVSGNTGGIGAALGSTYIRVAGTFDLAGFDSAVGIQSWSGASLGAGAVALNTAAPTVGMIAQHATKATAIDGQMQGELAGMPVGFYASYAKAPKQDVGGLANLYNANPEDRSSFNISAELGVLPEKAAIGLGIRRAKSGANIVAVAGVAGTVGTNASDNAVLLSGSYKFAQNMMLQLVYTKQSGDFWNAASGNTGAVGATQTALNLATLF